MMDSSGLKLDWLRAFLAFAETGSFTAAARRIHLSQPALHTQVKHLTAWVGEPLYQREGRRMLNVAISKDGQDWIHVTLFLFLFASLLF